ncbi:Sulfotransferase [Hordeum vulgare]|nr:Sulfotransferase [Hordeum vulgare]
MAAIAASWEAGTQQEAEDVPMVDAAKGEPTPSSSSVPPFPVDCTMIIDEARAHYMDMVRDEREEWFREAQGDAAFNL